MPEIKQFCENFWQWNEHVPWLVYPDSQPHKELMNKLTHFMRKRVGKSCIDLGCGNGEFLEFLLQLGECTIEQYFGVDLDWQTLAAIPRKLKNTAYCGKKVYLIHMAAMFKLPLRDNSVCSAVSSLGALMYIWKWHDQNGKLVASGRDALKLGLKDVHRIIKPGGYLGISAPLPHPNWRAIRNEALRHIIFHKFSLKKIWKAIYHGTKAVKYSEFMNGLEGEGKAHYLSPEEWKEYLKEAGFKIEEIVDDCYAGQGVIIIARKEDPS
ncbi:MAG: class I SAM-dependent methyltransferase [Patescibacteria group bacterium]